MFRGNCWLDGTQTLLPSPLLYQNTEIQILLVHQYNGASHGVGKLTGEVIPPIAQHAAADGEDTEQKYADDRAHHSNHYRGGIRGG